MLGFWRVSEFSRGSVKKSGGFLVGEWLVKRGYFCFRYEKKLG